MIDLGTALELCRKEEYIQILDKEYTPDEIKQNFNLQSILVKEIFFDRWNNVIRFEIEMRNCE